MVPHCFIYFAGFEAPNFKYPCNDARERKERLNCWRWKYSRFVGQVVL